MKRTLFLMAVIAMVPMMAWAGMTAITDTELDDVQGQAGITISMSMSQTMSTITWNDDGNEFQMGSVTIPTLSLTNVTIDVTPAGLVIDPGAGAIMTGTFQSVITVVGNELGLFTVDGLSVTTGAITIAGH